MSDPHNHHYVPQFLLRKFRDDVGRLWVYDTDLKKIYPAGTRKAGAVEDLYAIKKADGSIDYSTIETGFDQQFENAAAPVIEKLINREFLSGEEAFAFVLFVSAQLCRTPAFFGRIHDIIAPGLQEMCRRILKFEPGFRENLEKDLLEDGVPLEAIVRMFGELDRGEMEINPEKGFVMTHALKLIEKSAEDLSQMRWTFLGVPAGDVDLVLGDHPVTFYDDGPENGEIRHLGLKNPHLEIMLPLSKRLVACARWDGPISYGELMPGSVNAVNLRTLYHAQRYIFASLESEALMDVALKEKGTGPKIHVRRIDVDGKLIILKEYY